MKQAKPSFWKFQILTSKAQGTLSWCCPTTRWAFFTGCTDSSLDNYIFCGCAFFFLEKELLDIKYCTFLCESLISCLYILCITWLNSSEEDYNCCVNSHFNPLSQVLGLNWMTWLDIWPYVKTIEVEHWRMLWQLGWLLWDVSPEWLEEKQDIYLGADDGIKVFWITSFKSMGVNKTML